MLLACVAACSNDHRAETGEEVEPHAPAARPETPTTALRNPEWLATRRKPVPIELNESAKRQDRTSFGLSDLGALDPVSPDEPRDIPILGVSSRPDDGDPKPPLEVVRKALFLRTRRCICQHWGEMVHAVPESVRIVVDASTHKTKQVTLRWNNGDKTTDGPIADCCRRELADVILPVAGDEDLVVTDPMLHFACGSHSP